MGITTKPDRSRLQSLGLAAASFALFFPLGAVVSSKPPADWERSVEGAFAGQLTGLALLFTRSCHWYVLVPLGVAALALGFAVPVWRARAVFSVVLTLVAWQLSDALKILFHRERPAAWFGIHETTFAYPSGHAMFAVVVYCLWAFFAWRSALPLVWRRLLAASGALWALGILWSRLALGAHEPTDLIGGLLLGFGFVQLGFAVLPVVRTVPLRRPIITRSGRARGSGV